MKSHSHISLCDDKFNFFYDHVEFDSKSSVRIFLDLIFNMYQPESIDRQEVEFDMYQRVDDKNSNPIYFKSGDLLYIWVQCDRCRLAGLN